MKTEFNLVGHFTKKTRQRGGPLKVEQVSITLKSHIDPKEATNSSAMENLADRLAIQHTSHTPWELTWMTDWSLVPVELKEVA